MTLTTRQLEILDNLLEREFSSSYNAARSDDYWDYLEEIGELLELITKEKQ